MSIIIANGHKQTAEVEFRGHPDVFSTRLAAKLVEELAARSDQEGFIEQFRADLNVQIGTYSNLGSFTPIEVKFAGQLVIPDGPSSTDLEILIEQ